jgi:hypothetical protein
VSGFSGKSSALQCINGEWQGRLESCTPASNPLGIGCAELAVGVDESAGNVEYITYYWEISGPRACAQKCHEYQSPASTCGIWQYGVQNGGCRLYKIVKDGPVAALGVDYGAYVAGRLAGCGMPNN